jgi:topoisomerase-4 subunit B
MTWRICYNNIVIATDADVDGMHIFDYTFLQIFPELIKDGHLYILQTTFQSTKQERTIYCYSDEERKVAIEN